MEPKYMHFNIKKNESFRFANKEHFILLSLLNLFVFQVTMNKKIHRLYMKSD